MRAHEFLEARMKDLAYEIEWNREHGKQPKPTPLKKPSNYHLTINGKMWGDFATEKEALAVATNMYNKNTRLKINVIPH